MNALQRLAKLLILLLWLAGLLLPVQHYASASPDIFSMVNVIGKLVSAGIARKTTYQNSNAVAADHLANVQKNKQNLRDAYIQYKHDLIYGNPITKKVTPFGDRQLSSYVKQSTLLDLEKNTTTVFIEGEKNTARKTFDKVLFTQVQQMVMGSNLAQKLFGGFVGGLQAEKQLINLLSGKLDQLPGIDLQLRQLRTLSDWIRGAGGVFRDQDIDTLAQKLDTFSARIRSGAKLDQGDLDDIKKQVDTALSKMSTIATEGMLPDIDKTALTQAGLGLLMGNGSLVNQALTGLISLQSGKSYDQVQAELFTALEAGFKVRCRARATALKQELDELKQQLGVDVPIKAPEPLCSEMGGAKLPSQIAPTEPGPTPTDTSTPPSSTSGDPNDVPFEDDVCACGGFPGAQAFGGGDGISCSFSWTGDSGVEDKLNFTIHFYPPQHLDDLNYGSQQGFNDVQNRAAGAQPPALASGFGLGNLNKAVVVTGPGGASPKTGKPISLCGRGNGTYNYNGNYLVTTSLNACDLGEKPEGYVKAMQTLAACAMTMIEDRFP